MFVSRLNKKEEKLDHYQELAALLLPEGLL